MVSKPAKGMTFRDVIFGFGFGSKKKIFFCFSALCGGPTLHTLLKTFGRSGILLLLRLLPHLPKLN